MDDRMLQFALFLGVAVGCLALVALGIDFARRIGAHLRAPSAEHDRAPHHPELR